MSELVQEFAKTTTFKYFYSTLMRFDADLNCFVSTDKLRDQDAELLTAAWWMFQERQTKFYEMKTQLNNMEACYIEKKKQVDDCAALAKEWRTLAREMCPLDDKYVIGARLGCAQDIEEVLRGAND